MQRPAKRRDDEQRYAAADEGGDELRPAEGGGEGFQHRLFQRAGRQQRRRHHTADDLHHDQVQRGKLRQSGNEPRGNLLKRLPAVRTGNQPQQNRKHGVAHHDGGEDEDLRGDAQQIGKHRGEHSHDDAAAQSGGQDGNGQHGVDAGAGDELTKALGQRLQRDEKRQHNGGFGDPTYFFVHGRYLFPLLFFGDHAGVSGLDADADQASDFA